MIAVHASATGDESKAEGEVSENGMGWKGEKGKGGKGGEGIGVMVFVEWKRKEERCYAIP